jgi:hypothetical protein
MFFNYHDSSLHRIGTADRRGGKPSNENNNRNKTPTRKDLEKPVSDTLQMSKYQVPSSFGSALNKIMKKGEPLTNDQYNELVRLIAAPIALQTLKPHSDYLKFVARKVVTKYSNMSLSDKEQIDSCVSATFMNMFVVEYGTSDSFSEISSQSAQKTF